MDAASRFAALARKGLPFYEYAGEFCKLAVATAWDDTTLNRLFWFGANHQRPMDLPDTTGLSWREGVFQCLGSVRARARTSLPSFAALPHPPPFTASAGLPPFAAHSLLPFVARAGPPPSAALPHPPPFAANISPLSAEKFTPPFAAPPGPAAVSMASPPAVSMASPPAVHVASLPVAAPFRPVQRLDSALQCRPLECT